MAENLKVGEEVYYKSGGPTMLVELEEEGGMVICGWFDGMNHRNDRFPPATLERGKSPNEPPPPTIAKPRRR